jgi:hypothetical protein
MAVLEKKSPHENGAADKIQTVRDLIAGPQIRALEAKVDALSRRVEQLSVRNHNRRENYRKALARLQSEYDRRMQRMVRNAAQHRARTTARLNHIAKELQKVARQFEAEHESRAAFAKTMAALARQLRALPTPPQLHFPALKSKRPAARKKSQSDSSHAKQS